MANNYRFDPAPASTHTLLLERVPVNSKVLEIGTASGYLGEYLIAEKKCEVWGVEPVKEQFEDAKNYGYTKLLNLTAEQFLLDSNFAGEKFDVILLGDVLEHMVNPEIVLSGLTKYLKPSGRIVASLPNVAHFSIRIKLFCGKWDMVDAGILDRTHLRFFTRKTMLEMFGKAGLDILECRPTNGAMERFGINKLFGVGKKLLFFWPTFFAIQFVFVGKNR